MREYRQRNERGLGSGPGAYYEGLEEEPARETKEMPSVSYKEKQEECASARLAWSVTNAAEARKAYGCVSIRFVQTF